MCGACNKQVNDKEDSIICDGVCANVIHVDCTHLGKNAIKAIRENESVNFICDTCSSFSLRTISNKIDGMYKYLYEMNNRTKENQKNIESIKDTLNTVNLNVYEIIEASSNGKKTTTVALNKGDASKREEKNNNNRSEMSKSSKNMDKSKLNANEKNDDGKITPSISNNVNRTKTLKVANARRDMLNKNETPKQTNMMNMKHKQVNNNELRKSHNKKNETTTIDLTKNDIESDLKDIGKSIECMKRVIIKPKNDHNGGDILNDLTKKIDPNVISINKVKKTKNGGVIMEYSMENDSMELKEIIERDFGDRYIINELKKLKPKIKIFGMSININEEDLMRKLKLQNNFLRGSNIEVIKIFENYKKTFNAIIQVNAKTFSEMMKMEKVNIGWDKCKVNEHFGLVRCHKCSGFGHTQESCTRIKACGHYGNQHDSNKCNNENINCINCTNANLKFNQSLATDHNVWSHECEILKRKIHRITKITKYEDDK